MVLMLLQLKLRIEPILALVAIDVAADDFIVTVIDVVTQMCYR